LRPIRIPALPWRRPEGLQSRRVGPERRRRDLARSRTIAAGTCPLASQHQHDAGIDAGFL